MKSIRDKSLLNTLGGRLAAFIYLLQGIREIGTHFTAGTAQGMSRALAVTFTSFPTGMSA